MPPRINIPLLAFLIESLSHHNFSLFASLLKEKASSWTLNIKISVFCISSKKISLTLGGD
jgi:hypothetical protein